MSTTTDLTGFLFDRGIRGALAAGIAKASPLADLLAGALHGREFPFSLAGSGYSAALLIGLVIAAWPVVRFLIGSLLAVGVAAPLIKLAADLLPHGH